MSEEGTFIETDAMTTSAELRGTLSSPRSRRDRREELFLVPWSVRGRGEDRCGEKAEDS